MTAKHTRCATRARGLLASLQEKPRLLLMACLACAAVGVLWHQAWVNDQAIRSAAIQEASGQTAMLREFRSVYTSEVVSRISNHGVDITHDYAEKEGAIPLPATLSMLLGERMSLGSRGGGARLFSPYPFPWREDTEAAWGDFEQSAWDESVRNPDSPFFRFEDSATGPVLRYATADRMREGCIECHNTHPDSPKRDWELGDVRGVLEVRVPLVDSHLASLATALPLLALLSALGFTSLWMITAGLRREASLLQSDVKERTTELEQKRGQFHEAERLRGEAERYSQLVLQYAADPIVVVTSDGTILKASEAVSAVFGWDAEELVGQNLTILTPEQHDLQRDSPLLRCLTTTRELETLSRVEAQRRDGTVIRLDVMGSRVASASTPTFVGVLRDMTVQEHLEKELEGARRLEAIGQLAAGVAHEINTPTQYVGDNTRFLEESFRSLAPVLQKTVDLVEAIHSGTGHSMIADDVRAALEEADIQFLSEEIPRSIEETLCGVDRVRKIVQAMKEFSHPSVEEMSSIDLHRAIETTVTVATSEWKYIAEVETLFDPALGTVPCLPNEINQVILNLIVNAAHAITDVVGDGGKGKGMITISTRRDGEFAEIRVTDTGTGIPEAVRGRIFEPFFTSKEVGKGTGQGLAIARNIVVKRHGGSLEFETETDKGTTFIIRLPLVTRELSESAVDVGTQEGTSGAPVGNPV